MTLGFWRASALWVVGGLCLPLVAPVPAAQAAPAHGGGGWLGEALPLPLTVRTPQDLAIKQAAEKQYLIFNLLAGGKMAWDAGDFATAATKWEALLRVQGIDPDLDKLFRPLAREARAKAGDAPAATEPAAGATGATGAKVAPAPAVATVAVSGTVVGGGTLGTGGSVVWLKRATGETPRPVPAKGKVIVQQNKTFVPRVLAVPVGTKVDFQNQDSIFHNVFSLSKPNEFDTGLYRQGASYAQVFKRPGAVQLLCNIHSSMIGYVYVVDTPYYAQADGTGAFVIKGVPPGEYQIDVWHEGSSKETRQRLTVGADGVRGLSLKVAGDKGAPATVPDKSGKPRQTQLGY
jgi:plastocyanin